MSLKATSLAVLFAAAGILPARADKAGVEGALEDKPFEVACYAGGKSTYRGYAKYVDPSPLGIGIVDVQGNVIRSNEECVAIQPGREIPKPYDDRPFVVTCHSGTVEVYKGSTHAVNFGRGWTELVDVEGNLVKSTARCTAIKPSKKPGNS